MSESIITSLQKLSLQRVHRRSVRRRTHYLLSCALLIMALGTCAGSDHAASSAVLGRGPIWELAEEPMFSFSERPGAPELVLHGVRFGALLDSGVIVITNALTNLVFLDTAGQVLRVAGRRGEGPGEFGRIDGLHGGDGGFVVIDHDVGRASIFTASGDFVRTIAPPIDYTRIRGYDPEVGGIVTLERSRPREPAQYRVWSEVGQTMLEFSGPLSPPPAIRISYFPGTPEQGATVFSLPASCSPLLLTAVIGSSIYTVDALAGVVRAVSRAGQVQEIYRSPFRPRITAQLQNKVRSQLKDVPKDTVKRVLERWGSIGEALPVWSAILPDPSGRLWLQRADCPSVSRSDGTWDIIDLTGRELGSLTLPDSLSIRAARDQHVLVVRRDSMETEHLELYRLRSSRPGATADTSPR